MVGDMCNKRGMWCWPRCNTYTGGLGYIVWVFRSEPVPFFPGLLGLNCVRLAELWTASRGVSAPLTTHL